MSLPPRMVRLADHAPPDFLVEEVELTFDLDPDRTVVENRMRLRRAPQARRDAPLRLDGLDLQLVEARLDGQILGEDRLAVDAGGLTLAHAPDAFELRLTTSIAPRANASRNGLFEIGGQLATQCEPEGFRRLTYFPDRPDVLARYLVTLRADRARYPVLLSNGNLEAAGELEDGRHFARWRDPWPKPSYIFALVAGRFEARRSRHNGPDGETCELAVWAEAALIDQCDFALEVVERAFAWEAATYGLAYDLEVYNLVALSGWSGAMENKGLNLFGAAGVVARADIATDDDFMIIERIIGHEIFHNWTGNRVTCRDWFQLCLKEGLTRFRDQQFIEDKLGFAAVRIDQVKALRRNQFPEDDGPAAHPIQPSAYAEINNFYTNTIYDKGAEVVRMIRTLIGAEAFRRGFDLYIADNDGKAATTEDFLAAMEAASGADLAQFRSWYVQAGRPRVTARGTYEPVSRRYRLVLSQSTPAAPGQPTPTPQHIPILAGLISRTGRPLSFRLPGAQTPTREALLELRDGETEFVFDNVEAPPIPSLLRGFSAPVSLTTDLDDEDLARLMAHDQDPVARWDASQMLAVRIVQRLAADRAAGRPMRAPESYLRALDRVLDGADADPLVSAQILGLPDEPVLSEGEPTIDLDGHMAARAILRETFARRRRTDLLAAHAALAERGPYAPDAAGIARRKLKSAVLDLITALDEPIGVQLCLDQVRSAANMTDSFEALALIAHLDRPERQVALDWFYERWAHESVVIDKWFNAQALSRAAGAVDRIIALASHPAMDPTNLQRQLMFFGGFFRQNRVAFHDPSGKGYVFLADRLLEIDRLGRQGSHYLMPQINQWRRHDARRAKLMQQELQRVGQTPGLSRGLAENIARALA